MIGRLPHQMHTFTYSITCINLPATDNPPQAVAGVVVVGRLAGLVSEAAAWQLQQTDGGRRWAGQWARYR